MFLLNLYISIFEINNMEFTLDVSSHAFLSGDIRISSLCYINSTNSYVRIYKQIMQNKAKVKYAKINVNTMITMRYEKIDNWLFRQTKPKQTQLKPIQTQSKPIQSQLRPKQSQFKPNQTQSKPICLLSTVFCILFQTLTFRLLKL